MFVRPGACCDTCFQRVQVEAETKFARDIGHHIDRFAPLKLVRLSNTRNRHCRVKQNKHSAEHCEDNDSDSGRAYRTDGFFTSNYH